MQFMKLTEKGSGTVIYIAAHHITAVRVDSDGDTFVHVVGGNSFLVEEDQYQVYVDIKE